MGDVLVTLEKVLMIIDVQMFIGVSVAGCSSMMWVQPFSVSKLDSFLLRFGGTDCGIS